MIELHGRPLLLVGGGRMGEALLQGWLAGGLAPEAALVVEPDAGRRASLRERHGVALVAEVGELRVEGTPAAIVLAVKPQVMDGAVSRYRALLGSDTLVLSIAAGKEIAGFERVFGPGAGIVRAMPNTPAAVGRGISVLCANAAASAAQKALAEGLMRAVGEAAWVEDEALLHAVTALSGGGPAYVFLLIEGMAAAGEAAGLAPALALRLARATVTGAGELAHRSEVKVAELRRDVTSPAGTTEAALRVLMAKDGLEPLLIRAVAAAARRSRELA